MRNRTKNKRSRKRKSLKRKNYKKTIKKNRSLKRKSFKKIRGGLFHDNCSIESAKSLEQYDNVEGVSWKEHRTYYKLIVKVEDLKYTTEKTFSEIKDIITNKLLKCKKENLPEVLHSYITKIRFIGKIMNDNINPIYISRNRFILKMNTKDCETRLIRINKAMGELQYFTNTHFDLLCGIFLEYCDFTPGSE